MLKIKLLPILLLFNIFASAQDIFQFIDTSIVKIRTINPNDSNYTDLEPIGEAIGNSRVVMLGEQDHGDAPTFLTKARLIKYLHEKKGFDVIAFESNFYNLEKPIVQTSYQKFSYIYSIWTQCLECKPLFDYILRADYTPNPIILTGFDSRHKGTIPQLYTKDLASNLRIDTLNEKNKRFFNIVSEVIENEYASKCTKEDQSSFFTFIDSLIFKTTSTDPTISFWSQELLNLKAFASNAWSLKTEKTNRYDIRDIQMANNLLWLVQKKYPNKKVIVWAHSFHIAKNIQMMEKYGKQTTTLGTMVYPILKDDLYILGFTSLAGSSGRITIPEKYKIKTPTKKCPELIFASKELNYGFVDFKKYPKQSASQKYKMKMISHSLKKGVWHEMFDGVFYIKNMFPCESKKF